MKLPRLRRVQWILVLAAISVLVLAGTALAYRLLAPTEYYQLAFGPDAATRVLLALRDDTLSVHRSGRLEETAERLARDEKSQFHFEVVEPDGGRHTVCLTDRRRIPVFEDPLQEGKFSIWVKVNGAYWQYAAPPAVTDPERATAVHFNGPLSIQPMLDGAPWSRDEPTKLVATIRSGGTNGETSPAAVSSERDFFPDVFPVAELEFPHKDPTRPPIRVTAELKEHC